MKYYRATASNSEFQSVQSRLRRTNDIASLALTIIREHGEVSRRKLVGIIDAHKTDAWRYSSGTVEHAVNEAISSLSGQGLVEMLSFEQYVANGLLTKQQIANYATWLKYAGITIGHGHQNLGEYIREELQVFRRIGYYVSLYPDLSKVDAIKNSIRDVFGGDKAKKFEEWYKQYLSEKATSKKESTRLSRLKLIKIQLPPIVTIWDLDTYISFYNDVLYRSEPQGKLAHVHAALLERITVDFFRQNQFTRQYPSNLYFVLSEKDSKAETRKRIDALMQSTPTQNSFVDYKNIIFERLTESLSGLVSKLQTYLEEGFREGGKSIQAIDISKGSGTRLKPIAITRGLEIVRARYSADDVITLENIGQEKGGVTRERIRQLEAKGLEWLREQPSIQRLLSMEFSEIQ